MFKVIENMDDATFAIVDEEGNSVHIGDGVHAVFATQEEAQTATDRLNAGESVVNVFAPKEAAVAPAAQTQAPVEAKKDEEEAAPEKQEGAEASEQKSDTQESVDGEGEKQEAVA